MFTCNHLPLFHPSNTPLRERNTTHTQRKRMSHFNHVQSYGGNASPTMEQLLREGDVPRWSPSSTSPTLVREHDPEEDIDHHQKKSVFTKVKEKAKKLRYTLSNKKKHGEDDNATPSWGYNLDEDEDEDDIDAEYLGAPMYESELAPEDCKENARQHPRADPVIAENHVLAYTIKQAFGEHAKPSNVSLETLSPSVVAPSLHNIATQTEAANSTIQQTEAADRTIQQTEAADRTIQTKEIQEENEAAKLPSPTKTLTEAVTEKLAPVYSTVTDATHAIASKIQRLTVSVPSKPSARSAPTTPEKASSSAIQKTSSARAASKLGIGGADQRWDKGVSVKEYLMHKFEPGEDERALSQVLSDALSPKTSPRDVGVVEKMREAVNSMLRAEEATLPVAAKSSSQAKEATLPVAAKSSSQAKEAAQPMTTRLAAKSSSSRAEETLKPLTASLAAKSSSRAEVTPQPLAACLSSKSSSRAEVTPQPLAACLGSKSSSRVEEAPHLVARLATKPSSRAESAPQPILTAHIAAKSSSNTPVFTTAHRVAEEENLERILQAN